MNDGDLARLSVSGRLLCVYAIRTDPSAILNVLSPIWVELTSGGDSMSGSSLKVVDGAGRQIAGAIDDQPLRVQVELDIDPASAPREITVDVVGPDGTKETITAERIDWGADRPLYQTELTTMDEIFSQFFEVLNPVISLAPDAVVDNGEMVHFAFDDVTADVQTFDSAIDARYWFTRGELADRIGETTNRGINLTNALRLVRQQHESEARDTLEEQIEIRLTGVHSYLSVLERATATFNNPNYYAEQQIMGARYYMGIDDLRDAMSIHQVLENAKDTVHGHIISGVATITLGGYQMLVQSTGVAQARTMLTGEDEMGHAVTWDGRVTAFLDLVGDGLLQGAGMKFELDHLVTPTRIGSVDTRTRYDGPNPETLAPELSIVDPSAMGMPPEAVRAAFRVARMHDRIPLVRPTNPEALPHIAAGHLPKPESLKSKTVSELDTLLGMQPEHRGLVALFDPQTTYFESAMRTSGMSDTDIATQIDALRNGSVVEAPAGYDGVDLWNATAKRFIQRSEEFNGSTGVAIQKLIDAGEIRIEDGLIVDAASGMLYRADNDLFDFIDSAGRAVTPETYRRMVAFLESSEFRAQHGAHNWWDPQRSDFPAGAYGDAKFATYRGIYEKIIDGHKQGGEILIAFPPVGPPIAVFSGTAPGPYLGHMPGPWAPVAPGSPFSLPADIRLFGIGGTAVRGLHNDDSVQDWIDSENEFRSSRETHRTDESIDAFDAAALAAASRIGQLDADLDSDDDYDIEEFTTGDDGESSSDDSGSQDESEDGSGTDGSEAAFDAMAAAAAMQVAAQDADLESDEAYDLDEFSTGTAETAGGVPTSVWIGALGAVGVIIVLAGLFFGLGGSGETVTASTEPPVVLQPEAVTTPTEPETANPFGASATESDPSQGDDPASDEPQDTSEVVMPVSGQDPRAHINSVDPVTLADDTQGLVVNFAQPWGPMPPDDLFSFFVAFEIARGPDSAMAGWEVHNGSTTPLGASPMYIVGDGSVVIGTGLPVSGSENVSVSVQTGSWLDEATTEAVFADFSFDVPGGGPPFDMGLVVYDLVSQQPVEP